MEFHQSGNQQDRFRRLMCMEMIESTAAAESGETETEPKTLRWVVVAVVHGEAP